MRSRGSRGAIAVPMLLACGTLAFGTLGRWGILRHWRFLAETQLRLDRCTQVEALELKATQRLIERTNLGIHATRALILAGVLEPPAAAAARAALEALVLRQDAALLAWKARQLAWLLPGHCGSSEDLRLPLPGLDWTRPSPDPFGPMPLLWENMPERFVIRASRSPRHSVAEVGRNRNHDHNHQGKQEDSDVSKEWTARWVSPL